MKSKAFLVTAVMVMGLFIWGCGGSSTPVTSPLDGNTGQDESAGPMVVPLAYSVCRVSDEEPVKYGGADNMAGRNINIGTVSVVNDDLDLIITMETIDDWFIGETHIHVVNDPAEFPMTKKGNPIPGHFELKDTHDPMVQTFDVHYALDDLVPGDEVFIAAHAEVFLMEGEEVIQEESSWAAGIDFPGRNWATYFSYTVEE